MEIQMEIKWMNLDLVKVKLIPDFGPMVMSPRRTANCWAPYCNCNIKELYKLSERALTSDDESYVVYERARVW